MPPTFRSQETIYNEMKTAIQTDIPEITNWSPGEPMRAILSVVAAAIRIVYIVLQQLYFNMFPQTADLESQKNYYDEWGLTWDSPDLDTARATVLNKYRENSVIGTKKWYEDTVKANFSVVTSAALYPNLRGPGTADLVVSRNGLPVYDSDIADIQAFFDLAANKVLGMDLLVRTIGEDYASV